MEPSVLECMYCMVEAVQHTSGLWKQIATACASLVKTGQLLSQHAVLLLKKSENLEVLLTSERIHSMNEFVETKVLAMSDVGGS